MALHYGRGPLARPVDRRRPGERQIVDRQGALASVRSSALQRRPPDVGARGSHADDRVRRPVDGRTLGARVARADARVVRHHIASSFPPRPGGSARAARLAFGDRRRAAALSDLGRGRAVGRTIRRSFSFRTPASRKPACSARGPLPGTSDGRARPRERDRARPADHRPLRARGPRAAAPGAPGRPAARRDDRTGGRAASRRRSSVARAAPISRRCAGSRTTWSRRRCGSTGSRSCRSCCPTSRSRSPASAAPPAARTRSS